MTKINVVDFDQVIVEALAAAKAVVTDNWAEVRDIVENIGKVLVNDVEFLARKKLSGEFNEDDARIYMEEQKMVTRTCLRSIAIISLQLVERIWNAVADVFRTAIQSAIGWAVL